jgi:hypothetical protein
MNLNTADHHTNLYKALLLGGVEALGISELAEITGKPIRRGFQDWLSEASDAFGKDTIGQITDLYRSMVSCLGEHGAQGEAVQIGRYSFRYLLQLSDEDLHLADLQRKLLPSHERILTGLRSLAGLVGTALDIPVQVENQERSWVWACSDQNLVQELEQVSYFLVGMIQEFLSWSTSGRFYQVEHPSYLSDDTRGCLLVIHKVPLD